MFHNPRYLAFTVLCENEDKIIPLDSVIDKYADKFNLLSKRDRSFANAVIYGVLRHRRKLDWILSGFSSRKINTIDPIVLCLLRMGLFQIVFLDRVPVSAAVNTSVEIAKRVSGKRAAGFINAVLRKSGTGYHSIALPDIKKDPVLFLSVEKSMPLWLIKRWKKRFGQIKTVKLCDAINEIPFITVRANTLKLCRDALAAELSHEAQVVFPVKYARDGLCMMKPMCSVHEMTAFAKGYFQVQDEAAQLVSSILDPLPGENILDACAGLGGKTGHIAQLMENKGLVIAVDIDKNKLLSLEEEMKRLCVSIVHTEQMDILEPSFGRTDKPDSCLSNSGIGSGGKKESDISIAKYGKNFFDRVLLDAPCTGLGVLRKNPDSKWKRTLKDVKRLAEKQKNMLLKAAEFVKPGGVLVYSVCSCEHEENEEVVNYFIEKRPDFIINGDISCMVGKSNIAIFFKRNFFRTYPDNCEMDGFFAVSMRRKS